MAKKVFTDESLATFVDEIKSYTDGAVSTKANSSHTHSISNVTNLQSSLDAKVSTSTTVNGKALSSNITLSASDVGAATSGHTHSSYVNQNAFSNVKVGTTTVAADTTTDTLEIAAGTGISVSGDATNDKVTITNSGVRSIATGSSNGTISVNTNGTSANVAVKGLGSAAYKATTAFDAAGTAQTKADAALASAKTYTDGKIDAIIGEGASETLDTIGEISAAIEANQDVVDALNAAVGSKVDKVSGKGLSTNDYTTTEKNKLSGIAAGAQVNQNAFSNVKVGSTTIAADSTTDTLTLVAGSNITLTPDATGDSVTIAAKDTTYTLGSFGVTASATELNYVDGVTSGIQAQLDGKANSSHTHTKSQITDFPTSLKNPNSLTIQGNGTTLTNGIYDGSAAKTVNITPSSIGAAASGHNHSASNITSGVLSIERGGTGNNSGYVRVGAEEGSTIGTLATAEGRRVTASGSYSHAEGNYTNATGSSSHAEGQSSTAGGIAAHAQGNNVTASGNYSHAEGNSTAASAEGAHAEGSYTLASSSYQHVQGKYNKEDKNGIYAHIVGNGTGTSSSARSNAHTLDWEGNAWFAGDIYIGGTGQDNASKLFDLIYPVGSIYMSVNSTNPSTLFGGTWVAWGSGRVPVGVDTAQTVFATVEKTGGEKDHALTIDELAAHTHSVPAHAHGLNSHTHSIPALSGTTNKASLTGYIGNLVVESKTSYALGAGGICAKRTATGTGSVNAGGTSSSTTVSGRSDTVDIDASHSHTVTTATGKNTGAASGNTANSSVLNSGESGMDNAHNNLQPYITCYMWKRTA